jgi:hypothetical protein
MVLATQIIPAKGNKQHLLDLVTRIVEGKGVEYKTGGGQSKDTAKRVFIYESVSGFHHIYSMIYLRYFIFPLL